jgi:hypothetical protein
MGSFDQPFMPEAGPEGDETAPWIYMSITDRSEPSLFENVFSYAAAA